MRKIFIASFLLVCATAVMAQNTDTVANKNIRKGWTFGALPSVSYDADYGFQYGALTNIYYFGDGSTYPEYLHSLYLEASYTTKRYGVFRFFYDSKFLIPNHRLTVDMSYLPDALSDFYGFNGYQAVYNPDWTNDESDMYVSRAFYKMKRDLFRFATDIQGALSNNWYWNAGAGVLGYKIGNVDVDMLNKGKDAEDQLPDTAGLYEKYVLWDIIPHNEANGGWHPYLRGGITYDTRNQQQNPSRGIYTDAFLTYTAAFGDMKDYNNLKFNFNFRQYIPITENISLAYRVGTQLTLAGKSPFYLNTYMNTLFIQRVIYEGLGGGNSLRGIVRNRILSDGFAFANVELRLKLWNFKVGKENFYIGINPLFDAGMVLQPYDINKEQVENNIRENDPSFDMNTLGNYFNFDESLIYKPHLSAGIGLKVAMNENFIVSVDWATPLNKADNGKMSNLYIKIGYMF
ncbi:MAG: BamA/TamA family outer membrane protein [Bacteroidales bacterium]|nr:BamA/TamA family outer membrane protein [Bacteroidales bacterium]